MAKPPQGVRHHGKSTNQREASNRPEDGRDRPRHDKPPQPQTPGVSLLFGYHTVREALLSPRRRIARLFATPAAAQKLGPEIAAHGLQPILVEADAIAARLPRGSVHQGLLAEVKPLEPIELDALPAQGLILVLDQITDPHNFGAILRTAAAFGVDAVVTTERHSPQLGGALAKSASGALEHVPMCHVVNLARAMEALEDKNYQRIGLDSDASTSLEALDLRRPLALVLGAEGKGLRRLTRENCDSLARLDLPGPIRSLNVSNACAVALTIARFKLPRA